MRYSKRRDRSSLHSSRKHRRLLTVEALESRTVPYATIAAWPHPELITLSFMPDGTYLGGSTYSNLFATFNARWPTAAWQGKILLAAQYWAQFTNINFAVVPDNGLPIGSGAYQQGDPGAGDIRIGGFNFGNNDLGGAWFPPPVNNFPAAGDLFFNTAQPFNIGYTYDLFTVSVHELGHALGLLHSSDYYAAMYGAYVGLKEYGLTGDDIAGIRSLYSAHAPRSPDGFGYYTNSFQRAADLTGAFHPVTQVLVGPSLDITYPGQAEYYRFLAPDRTSPRLTVTVQSSGLSLLSPHLTLYNAYQQPIASVSGYGQYGTTLSVTVGGVVPTQLFWLRVSGAEVSPLGIGRYALIVNFGTGASPTVPPTNTATPNGVPNSGIGGMAEQPEAWKLDDGGFDTFEVNGERAAPLAPDGSTPARQLPSSDSAPVAVSAAADLVMGVKDRSGQGSLLVFSAVPASAAALARAVGVPLPPLTVSWEPQPASARTESGGGNNGVLLAREELPEEATSWTDAVASGPHGQPDTPAASVSSPAARWRAACTACFSGKRAMGRPESSGAAPPSSGETDFAPGLNSAAALTGLAVALGGYWGAQPEEVRAWRSRALAW